MKTEVGVAHQAVGTMTLKHQLVWLDSCSQSQDRLVATESSAARKVNMLSLVLPSPAEREAASDDAVQAPAAAGRGHKVPWGSLYPDQAPTARLVL